MFKDELKAMAIAVVPTFTLACVLALTGCSSAPRKVSAEPYCTTNEEIRVKNGDTVSSERLVKCTDDRTERIVMKKAGMAQNCGEVVDYVELPGGKTIQTRNLVCQKFNGRWEYIPEYTAR